MFIEGDSPGSFGFSNSTPFFTKGTSDKKVGSRVGPLSDGESGPTLVIESSPLFIGGPTTLSGYNIPLTISGGDPGELVADVPFYISNSVPYQPLNGFNLFIRQGTLLNTFRTRNPAIFGDVFLYPASPTLFIRGTTGFERVSPPLPLFVRGFVNGLSKGMNLFISNKRGVEFLPLFIWGDNHPKMYSVNYNKLFVHGNVRYTTCTSQDLFGVPMCGPTLFIQQNIKNISNVLNPIRLFVKAPLGVTSAGNNPTIYTKGDVFKPWSISSPLYLFAGGVRSETINLFIQADTVPELNIFTTLALMGSAQTASLKAVPLRVVGHLPYARMNLVIEGKDSGGKTALVNLWVEGGNNPVGGSVPLVVVNNSNFIENQETSLFTKGLGKNPGHFPHGGVMGLYIQRGPNGGITLYLQQSRVESLTPLHIIGSPVTTGIIPLFLEGQGGVREGNVPITLSGGNPNTYNSFTTIVIPRVVGFEPESATLYTSGFEY